MLSKLITYYQGKYIPALPGENIFHSKELFMVYESTPGYTPVMIVGYMDEKPVAKILAVIRKNTHSFLSVFTKKCEVYDTVEYLDDQIDKESVFGEMLEHLTQEIIPQTFLIEFRNLSQSLFGYKYFRNNHYFPVNWLRVKNYLHPIADPMDKISESRRRQIKKGLKNGAVLSEAQTESEIKDFSRMLQKNYSAKMRKHFPGNKFFQALTHNSSKIIGKIFIVKYKEKIIGGSVCLFSGKDIYLWFSGGMKKTYPLQYPGILAVWEVIDYAHQNKFQHIEFMDVGLPFKKHGYRDFVLRFGGKQSSTIRWFRFNWTFLNKILTKIYV